MTPQASPARRGPKVLADVPAEHLRMMVTLLRSQVAMLERQIEYQQKLLREVVGDGLLSLCEVSRG